MFTQLEVDASERLIPVLDLAIAGRYDEAHRIVAEQAASMEHLSPYEQSCIYLTLAWLDQHASRTEDAGKNFEKGSKLGAPIPPKTDWVRSLLLDAYQRATKTGGLTVRDLRGLLRELPIQRSTGAPTIPPRPPSTRFEPDLWPGGFPRERALDI